MIKKIFLIITSLFLLSGCGGEKYDCDTKDNAYTALLLAYEVYDADEKLINDFNKNFESVASYSPEFLKMDKKNKESYCRLNIKYNLNAKSITEANKKRDALIFVATAFLKAKANEKLAGYYFKTTQQAFNFLFQGVDFSDNSSENLKKYNDIINKSEFNSDTSYDYKAYDNGRGKIYIEIKE